MITKWDIISRLNPKTREIQYTLLMDGVEADARHIVKRLKGYLRSAKMADPPFVYAFRLPTDLDEITLEKIRQAVRDVVNRVEKIASFVPTEVGGTLFNTVEAGNDSVKGQELTEKPKKPFEKLELDLDAATIISLDRIGNNDGLQLSEETIELEGMKPIKEAPAVPAGSPNNGSEVQEEKAPTVISLDETHIDLPDIDPEQTSKFKFSFGFGKKEKKSEPQQPNTPKENKVMPKPVPGRFAKEYKRPSIDMEGMPTLDKVPSSSAEETKQPAAQEKTSPNQEESKQDKKLLGGLFNFSLSKRKGQPDQPSQQEEEKNLPQEEPESTRRIGGSIGEIELDSVEAAPVPKAETLSGAEQTPQAEHVISQSEQMPHQVAPQSQPERQVPQPQPERQVPQQIQPAQKEDEFPQIRVQVRPVSFEEQNKPVAGPQPLPEQVAQPAQTAQPQQQAAQEVPVPQPLETQERPQQTVEQAPEPVIPAQTQPEESAAAQIMRADKVVNHAPSPQTAEPELQAQDAVPAQEENSQEPLNFSLEDLFLAETKYDAFVDVDALKEAEEQSDTQQGENTDKK